MMFKLGQRVETITPDLNGDWDPGTVIGFSWVPPNKYQTGGWVPQIRFDRGGHKEARDFDTMFEGWLRAL